MISQHDVGRNLGRPNDLVTVLVGDYSTAVADNESGPGDGALLDFGVNQGGTFFIQAHGNVNSTVYYRVRIDELPRGVSEPGDGYLPNSNQTTGSLSAYGDGATARLQPNDDQSGYEYGDGFRIDLAGGQTFRITVSLDRKTGGTNLFRSAMHLYDSDYARITGSAFVEQVGATSQDINGIVDYGSGNAAATFDVEAHVTGTCYMLVTRTRAAPTEPVDTVFEYMASASLQ